MDRLKSTVERAVLGRADVRQATAQPAEGGAAEPQSAHSALGVHGQRGLAIGATLIQVVAEDRPGLLYDIASAISSHGASIDVVLIDTEAHKAIDVFYVTAGGEKLTADKQREFEQALAGSAARVGAFRRLKSAPRCIFNTPP